MNWPTSQDYNEAIQNAATSFAEPDLKAGEVALNSIGLPVPRSGNFADVYEFKTKDGKKWALKLFTRKVAGLQERYAKIDEHLSRAKFPFTVGFKYLAEGIRIRGEWFPLLKMEWVEGFTLNEFIRDNAGKPQYLHALMQMWGKLTALLRDADFAHADLQHGNVLMVPATSGSKLGLRLIDYDGMWVPALAETHSGEVGHPNFQHPLRLKDRLYNADVDRFPHLVIAAALRATLIGGKPFWDKFDNGDNLLFKETDLRDPANSPVFKALWNLHDPVLCMLVGKIALASKEALRKTPWLDDLLLTDEGKQLQVNEETKVMQMLGVGPHFTAAKTAASAAPAVQDEFNAFAFEDEAPQPANKPKDKSANHKALAAKEDKKPKSKDAAKEEKKSKLPLFIGGGVAAVLAIVGIIIAASSGGSKPTPTSKEVAKIDKNDPDEPKIIKKDNTGKKDPENIGKKDPENIGKKDPENIGKKDREIVAKKDPPKGTLAQPQRIWKTADPVNFNGLAFSDDGSKLFRSLGKDLRTIHVHSAANPKPQLGNIPFPPGVYSLQTGPDDLLAITTINNRLDLFDLKSKSVRFSADIADRLSNCPFAEKMNAILVLEPSGKIAVLSLVDGKKLDTHELPEGVTGKYLDCTADGKTIAVFGSNWEIYTKIAGEPAFKSIFKVVGSAVRKIVLSPDGAYVAKSANNQIHILETATGKQHRLLSGHNAQIQVILFSNDGRYLFSLSKDKTCRVWDIEADKLLYTLDVEGEGKAMALSVDGQSLAIGAENEIGMQLWRLTYDGATVVKKDVEKKDPEVVVKKDPVGVSIGEPEQIWSVAARADGNCLVFANDGSQLLRSTGSQDLGKLFFHSAADGTASRDLMLSAQGIATIRMGPDDVICMTTGDNKLVVVEMKTQKERFSVDVADKVVACPVAGQRKAVMVHERGGGIGVYSLVDGAKIETHQLPPSAQIRYFDCSSDGKTIVAFVAEGPDSVVYSKTPRDQTLKAIYKASSSTGRKVFLSPDGAYVAIFMGSQKEIRILETANGKEHHVLNGHSGEVRQAGFTLDGRYLLSISQDKTLRVWSVETGKEIHNVSIDGSARAMALSPDGQFVAVSTDTGRSLQLWRIQPRKDVVAKKDPEKKDPPEVTPMPKSTDELTEAWKVSATAFLTSLSFSKDGSRLAAAYQGMEVSLLDARNGSVADRRKVTDSATAAITFANDWLFIIDRDRKLFVWDLKNKAKSTAIDSPVFYAQQFAIAVDKDVVFLPIQRGEIGMYSLKDLKKAGAIPIATPSEIQWISTTADGENVVAVTTGGEVFAKTKSDTAFKLLTTFAGGGHRRVAIAPDGKSLAFSMNKEPIRILNIADGKEQKTLEGHTDEVLAIQFLADGKTLASIARDDTLRVWNAETGKQVQEVKPAIGRILAMAVSPDGKAVAVGSGSGMQMWRVGSDGGTVVVKKDPDPMPKMVDPKKDMKVEPKAVVLKEELIKTSAALSDDVVSVSYSFDGKRLHVATKKGIFHVLDPLTLEETTKYAMLDAEVRAAVAAPKTLGPTTTPREWIYILDANRHLRVYDAEKKTLTKSDIAIDNVGFGSSQIIVTPDAKTLIFMSRGGFGGTSFWDLKSATDLGPAVLMRSPFQRSSHWVTYSHDNKYGAAISSTKLLVWNQRTGADIRLGDCRDAQKVVIVPDANIVVVTGRRFGGGRFAHSYTAWNFVTGKELWDKEVTGECQSLVAIPKSNRILSSNSTEITLRDAVTGDELLKWKPTDSSTNLTVSPDGKYLVTNNEQGNQVKLWLLPAPPTGKKP